MKRVVLALLVVLLWAANVSAADRYWVGGSATWDATDGTKWASSSGGAGGQTAPTTSDNVFFDGNSGSVSITVTIGTAAAALNVDLTGWKGILSLSGTWTITGDFKPAGVATQRLMILSNTVGTARTISAATLTGMAYVTYTDITAGGAAATPWAGTGIGDGGGNTGITAPAAVTRYRVGAAGNYSDITKWSASSGGATSVTAPLPQDTVLVDANASGTISLDFRHLGTNVDFTGFGGQAAFNTVNTFIYGSLVLASGQTTSGTASLTFAGRSGSFTIRTNGVTVTAPVVIAAFAGTYTLADPLVNTQAFAVSNGTFATANFALSILIGSSTSGVTRAIQCGTSQISLTATSASNVWNISNTTGLTLSCASAEFIIPTVSVSTRTFIGGSQIYGTITYMVAGSLGGLVLSGTSNTFDTINFSDVTNARPLSFTAGGNTTVRVFNVNGTVGQLMSVTSLTPGTPTTLTKSGGGQVRSQYLSVQDVTVLPATSSWYALQSTNVSGNKDVRFHRAVVMLP